MNRNYNLFTEMDYLISMAGGFAFKTLDEIQDIDFIKSSIMKQYAIFLCIAIISLVLFKNINISYFFALCVIPVSYYLNQVDTLLWTSLMPLPFIAIFLQANAIEFSLSSIIKNFFLFVSCSISCIIESQLFPEEISFNKFWTRILIPLIFILFVYIWTPPDYVTNIVFITLGYCIASTLIKLYSTDSSILFPLEEFKKYSEENSLGVWEKEMSSLSEASTEFIRAYRELSDKSLKAIIVILYKYVVG